MKIKGLCLLLAMLFFITSCSDPAKETIQGHQDKPVIVKVETNLPEKNGWFIAPDESTDLMISVQAQNTDTVLFWLVPAGTETWKERTLLGYDTDESDGWNLNWNTGGNSLHHHIYIQALGSDGVSMASETINITNE